MDKTGFAISPKTPTAIEDVLASHEIGAKLNRLRLRKKISLVDLGKHTGLSASLLSQLENGKLTPTLPTLARIAMVFDVGLDHFFEGRQSRKVFCVVRSSERIRLPDTPDLPSPSYFFECLAYPAVGKSMQAYFARFPRRTKHAAAHFHDGWEFLYVVEGKLEIRIHAASHQLAAGDSLYFDASEPHSYRGAGQSGASAIVVALPLRI